MEESRNKRLIKNSALLYSRMALSMVVSLFTSRIVLRTLGFDDYGVYGVIGGVVTMFTFLNGAMSGASSRFIAIEVGKKDYKQLSTVFSTLFFSHVFIAGIVLVLSETVGLWLLMDKLVIPDGQMRIAFWVYQISIISTMFSITIVPYSAMLIAHENMKIYAYVSIVQVFLRLLTVYLLIVLPGSKLLVWSLLGLVIQIGVNIFYRIYVRMKYEGSEIRFVSEKSLYKNIFGFVGSDLIGNISVLAQGQGLNILLNIFFGPAVNAARSIAYSVQGITQQFSGNFLTAMRPQIIKLHAEGENTEMMTMMNRGSLMGFYLLWLLVLPVMINAHYVLELWLGEYPEYSVPFLQIILLISLVQVLKTPRTMVFHALGKLKKVNLYVGTILVMTFPIAYVFLKLGFGPTSVFWITLIDIFFTEFVSVVILKEFITFNGMKYLKDVHLRCFSAAILSALLPAIMKFYYPENEFIPVALNCMLCLVSMFAAIYLVGFSNNDRVLITGFIKRKIFKHE